MHRVLELEDELQKLRRVSVQLDDYKKRYTESEMQVCI
jgi:hypothetical protein